MNFTAISLFTVLSAISGTQGPVAPAQLPVANTIDSAVVRQVEDNKSAKEVTNETENYVRNYFKDIPIMIQVAKCESHFRQFDSDGGVHRGVVNSADVGVMQINERYHLTRSEKSNLDIYTIEGNTAYARKLYNEKGTQPWVSSKPCWGKYENKDLAMNSK